MQRIKLKKLRRDQKRNRARRRKLALMAALEHYFDALTKPIRLDVEKILSEAVRAVIAQKEDKIDARPTAHSS